VVIFSLRSLPAIASRSGEAGGSALSAVKKTIPFFFHNWHLITQCDDYISQLSHSAQSIKYLKKL